MLGKSFLALLPLVALASGASVPRELFAVSEHLGNLSPYFPAPVPLGMETALPGDCTVEQVMLMQRHGARYPLVSELAFITGLVEKLGNHSTAIQKARLPASLAFLKDGYVSTLGHDDLTAPGRQELFDHGVKFALTYPHLKASSLLVGAQDRVIESAQWFANGYFGRSWGSLNATRFQTIAEDSSTVSWITPMDTCARWDYNYGNNATVAWGTVYLPPIARRLNALLPGVGLSADDVHGALYACAYDLAAHGTSPWCGAFTDAEIAAFEYELDLLMDGAFGYSLPRDMGAVLGSLYVAKLVDRFSNVTGDAQEMYLEFGHDTTIDMVLTALGLAKDTHKLPEYGPIPWNRKWRTSYQVPFAAMMTWEKFTCSSSFKGPQIRLVLNEAPMPLTTCKNMNKKYGSCALSDFVSAHAQAAKVSWGDATWNASCGAGF